MVLHILLALSGSFGCGALGAGRAGLLSLEWYLLMLTFPSLSVFYLVGLTMVFGLFRHRNIRTDNRVRRSPYSSHER